jgi:hypothetical protein
MIANSVLIYTKHLAGASSHGTDAVMLNFPMAICKYRLAKQPSIEMRNLQ